MTHLEACGPNAEQIRYWNEAAGAKWVTLQGFIDAQIRPLGHLAMERAAILPGERVLDVGCGCGETTIDLAARGGAAGKVLGVDLSGPMLEQAQSAAARRAVANVEFRQADAQTHPFEGNFDVVFSRFGVMFFSDPRAAFTNLGAALAPAGRLAFVCWQGLDKNPWMMVPLMAALQHLPPPPLPDPLAPGPFAFADAAYVRRILGDAGFTGVAVEPLHEELTIGGDVDFDGAVGLVLKIGPVGRLLEGANPTVVAAVTSSVRESLQSYRTPRGIRMSSAAWLVSGRWG